MNENVLLIVSCVLACLLAVSETLPESNKVKSNSVFRVIISIATFLKEKIFVIKK